MTTFNMTCEAVEATLPDYLDETLEPWLRTSIEEHLEECARCTSLARELRNITREAAALPALLPERDVWQRVAGRIGAPVTDSRPVAESAPENPIEPIALASDPSPPFSQPPVVATETPVPASEPPVLTREPLALVSEPLLPSGTPPVPTTPPTYAFPGRHNTRWEPRWVGLAAAAVLLVAVGTTFIFTARWLGPARTANVASDTGTRRPSTNGRSAGLGIRGLSAGREQVASDSSNPTPGQLGSALVSAELTPSPEEVVYDKEIHTLQRIVRRQKAQLDTSTVAAIEKNLRSLDAAIAQIRAALKKDPGSSLLGGQASRALEMKVELLRRTAMLRSST